MNSKTIQKLLSLLLILAAVWFIQGKVIGRKSTNSSGIVKFDPTGTSSEIKRIVIIKGDESTAMSLKDGIWFLENDKPLGEDRAIQADADLLVKILDGINVEIVSQSEAKHTSLGVDEKNSYLINYYKENSSEPQLTIRVSNKNSKHFRQDKMVNVYAWDNDYMRIISKNKDTWIEPTPTISPTPIVSPEVKSSSQ